MSARFRRPVRSPRTPERETGYLERVLAFGLLAGKPGEVIHINVQHDNDCPRLAGGKCECTPDIEAVRQLEQRRA
jgi:hypothetical protein